jgi:hypothetical protein
VDGAWVEIGRASLQHSSTPAAAAGSWEEID